MNKTKYFLVITLLLSVLLVAGCTGRQDTSSQTDDQSGANVLEHDDEFATAVQDFSTILTDTQDAQSDMGDFSTDDASTPSAG